MQRIKITVNGMNFWAHPESKHQMSRYYKTMVRKGEKYAVLYLHRYVYERVFGEIPDGCHIHHKDHNIYNNSIENLELLSRAEHAKLHNNIEGWSSSEQGKAILRRHGSDRYVQNSLLKTIDCEVCGQEVTKRVNKGVTLKYCSAKCNVKAYRDRQSGKLTKVIS